VRAPDETADNLLQVDGIGVNGNSVDTEDIWKMAVLKQIEKCYNFNNLQKHFSLAGVRIAKPTEIILYETAGTRKILLINEDIPWKMEQLRATLEECEKDSTEWEYVDLRFENPYVKHTKSNTDAPRSRKQ